MRLFFIMSYDEIISFDNLYQGLQNACKGIRWKDSTVGYEGNALKKYIPFKAKPTER